MTSQLREFRTRKGLSQCRLAQLISMNPAHLGSIERGATCTKSTAARIATALEVDPETVFPSFKELRGA